LFANGRTRFTARPFLKIGLALAAASALSGCGGAFQSPAQSPFLTKTAPWAAFRGDFQNTGRGTGTGATGHVKWSFQTLGAVFSVAVVGKDGTIYIGSTDGFLYALDPNGAMKWKFQTATLIAGNSASIGPDGTIYVGDLTSLYAIDPATGTQKWKFDTTGSVLSSPVVTDKFVYFGSFYANPLGAGDPTGPYDGHVYAVDPATGTLKWSYLTGGAVGTSGAIGPDGSVYFGSYDGKEYAFDGETGAVRWTYQTGGPVQSSASLSGNMLYFGSHDHTLYAVDVRSGALKFKVTTGQRIVSSPSIALDGTVYFGSWDGYVYAVNGQTGKIKWKFFTSKTATPGLNDEAPTIGGDGSIYYETNEGGVFYSLNGKTGHENWELPVDPLNYASIAVDPNGTLYVGSLSGKLIAIN